MVIGMQWNLEIMMNRKIIPFERLCIGMVVLDVDGDEGRIQNLDDIHNIEIQYNIGGAGLSCQDNNCKDYSSLYWKEGEEYDTSIIDSLDNVEPNIEDFSSCKEYSDALLVYIERIKQEHLIEIDMMGIALKNDDNLIQNYEKWVSERPTNNDEECEHRYINAGTLQGNPMKKCLECGKYIESKEYL